MGARFARFLVVVALLLSVPLVLFPRPGRLGALPLALRNPEKFAVLLAFGLAVLSGLASDELARRRRLPRWILAAGVALGAAAVVAAAFPGPTAPRTAVTRVSAPFRRRRHARFQWR